MSTWYAVCHADSGQVVLARAKWCASYGCRLRGLMFRRRIAEDEGLLFVFPRPTVLDATIHMFFVFFPIAAVWLDGDGRVVDARLAKPWRPFYKPARPARYLIEAHPALLERVRVGERLRFEAEARPPAL